MSPHPTGSCFVSGVSALSAFAVSSISIYVCHTWYKNSTKSDLDIWHKILSMFCFIATIICLVSFSLSDEMHCKYYSSRPFGLTFEISYACQLFAVILVTFYRLYIAFRGSIYALSKCTLCTLIILITLIPI